MIIGVPKEIKGQEYRVALLPSAAYQLIKRGHKVVVEHNAGAGIGYDDADYESAGATIVQGHAAVRQHVTGVRTCIVTYSVHMTQRAAAAMAPAATVPM